MNHIKQHHAKVVTALGEYYSKAISQNLLEMFVEDLMVLTQAELQAAVKLYRENPKNVFFPLPATLVSLVKPRQTHEDASREAAARIIECLSSDGYTNAHRAKERMGELAWEVVQRQGGWVRLCQEISNGNVSIVQAQLRELAATLYRKAEMGLENKVPGLPESRFKSIGHVPIPALRTMPKDELMSDGREKDYDRGEKYDDESDAETEE